MAGARSREMLWCLLGKPPPGETARFRALPGWGRRVRFEALVEMSLVERMVTGLGETAGIG